MPGRGGLLVHVRRLRELPELLEQGAQAESGRRRGFGMRGGDRRLVGSPGGGGVAEGQCELGQLDRCVRACILVPGGHGGGVRLPSPFRLESPQKRS